MYLISEISLKAALDRREKSERNKKKSIRKLNYNLSSQESLESVEGTI